LQKAGIFLSLFPEKGIFFVATPLRTGKTVVQCSVTKMRRYGLMNCMKCGRDISAEQVFCDSCLQTMEKYPVKPDTAVQLPRRSLQGAPKKQPVRRRQIPPEEQVTALKKRCRRLTFAVVLLCLLLLAAGAVIFLQMKPDPASIPIGRNYTIDTTPND
jgi:hypothetical protein